jgi:DNA (cytosine-5)-methyltransferase 1
MTPRVLDLFCGAVGGWSIGLHRAGFETVAACEIDPWRRAVFQQNFPKVRMYEDVRQVSAAGLVSDLGYLPDIIVGSPPCQDASAANTKGRGVDGAQTGLFFEAIRIVGECRPRWCAFENSPRLRTRGYDRLADAFQEIGYACWPPVVGADDIGAPHERKRVWIIAADASTDRCGQGLARRSDPGFARQQDERRSWPGEKIADTISDGVWIEPRRGGRADRPIEAVAAKPADADCGTGGVCASGSFADGSGPAGQLAALERAVGPAVHSWNGGAARHLRMAHELAPRMAGIRVPDHKNPGATINAAKACISAQGDAILPDIAYAICRAILRTEAALQAVRSAA